MSNVIKAVLSTLSAQILVITTCTHVDMHVFSAPRFLHNVCHGQFPIPAHMQLFNTCKTQLYEYIRI